MLGLEILLVGKKYLQTSIDQLALLDVLRHRTSNPWPGSQRRSLGDVKKRHPVASLMASAHLCFVLVTRMTIMAPPRSRSWAHCPKILTASSHLFCFAAVQCQQSSRCESASCTRSARAHLLARLSRLQARSASCSRWRCSPQICLQSCLWHTSAQPRYQMAVPSNQAHQWTVEGASQA